MTGKCEKFYEKNLPYESCKKKIGYFQTLGGGGWVSDKVGKFQFFFNPSLSGSTVFFCNASWLGHRTCVLA